MLFFPNAVEPQHFPAANFESSIKVTNKGQSVKVKMARYLCYYWDCTAEILVN